jgi:hypothetical protein
MKNMTLWPFFQVSTPAETKQASQMRPNNPPHRYHALRAKGMKLLLRRHWSGAPHARRTPGCSGLNPRPARGLAEGCNGARCCV